MFAIIGLVLLMVFVFGGYIIAGGSMAPIIKAAPIETFIIVGAGVAAMLVGNGMDVLKGVGKGFGKVFKGPAYKKDDYLSTIFVVSKIMKTFPPRHGLIASLLLLGCLMQARYGIGWGAPVYVGETDEQAVNEARPHIEALFNVLLPKASELELSMTRRRDWPWPRRARSQASRARRRWCSVTCSSTRTVRPTRS